MNILNTFNDLKTIPRIFFKKNFFYIFFSKLEGVNVAHDRVLGPLCKLVIDISNDDFLTSQLFFFLSFKL
jgi:hypothetical protein